MKSNKIWEIEFEADWEKIEEGYGDVPINYFWNDEFCIAIDGDRGNKASMFVTDLQEALELIKSGYGASVCSAEELDISEDEIYPVGDGYSVTEIICHEGNLFIVESSHNSELLPVIVEEYIESENTIEREGRFFDLSSVY